MNGESDDGGFDELVEFIPNRRFNSAFSASSAATRVRSSAITRACSTTSAASSSYDGRPSPACTPLSSHVDDHALTGPDQLLLRQGRISRHEPADRGHPR